MSLATSATPLRVWIPATAQLLLPGLASSSPGFGAGTAKRSSAGKGCVSTCAAPAQAACRQRASAA
jgi:hypothetical protein